MGDNQLPTDFDKEFFEIRIIACEGGLKLDVRGINKYAPSIHEIIGALEYMKHHLIDSQREKNKPLAEEYNKQPKEKDASL